MVGGERLARLGDSYDYMPRALVVDQLGSTLLRPLSSGELLVGEGPSPLLDILQRRVPLLLGAPQLGFDYGHLPAARFDRVGAFAVGPAEPPCLRQRREVGTLVGDVLCGARERLMQITNKHDKTGI